jgi:hypothetical protein
VRKVASLLAEALTIKLAVLGGAVGGHSVLGDPVAILALEHTALSVGILPILSCHVLPTLLEDLFSDAPYI